MVSCRVLTEMEIPFSLTSIFSTESIFKFAKFLISMKTLLLVRHAKSSWNVVGESDFDRSLNGRGKVDAPEMASRLIKRDVQIDLFVSSPAKRARKTAEIFVRQYDRDEREILFVQELYEAELQTFYNLISGLRNDCNSVAIFGHNPSITDFVNDLTEIQVDNIPTCGVFALNVPIEKWKGFAGAKKNFLFFDYPKGS
jgi:phosphohistidine phosphatase